MIRKAIDHFTYGITHDIFKEPVTSYAALAINALNKQVPKNVIRDDNDESDYVYCPCCNEIIGSNENVYDDFYYRGWKPMYCQECGQAMIWRE